MSVIREITVGPARPHADSARSSVPVATPAASASTTALLGPRLLLDKLGPRNTLLDGGCWPRSTDPIAELPSLVSAIEVLRGPITRLLLGAGSWEPRPRRLAVGDRMVRLAFFASQPAALLTALSDNGARVDLLVVPPDTSTTVAVAAMMRAASATNRVHAQDIIAAVAADQRSAVTRLGEQVWGFEGGTPLAMYARLGDGGRHTIGVGSHEHDR